MIASGGTATLGLYDLKRKIDAFGGVDYFRQNLAGGYLKNARVMLDNGDIVKSTINGNANDPNVNMTGWEIPKNGIESISDLRALRPAKKGERVYLISANEDQNEGGGEFIATQKSGLVDDGGTIIASPDPLIFWCRINYDHVTPEMFGAVGYDGLKNTDSIIGMVDSNDACQKSINHPFPTKLSKTYLHANPLVVRGNCTIEGNGVNVSGFLKTTRNTSGLPTLASPNSGNLVKYDKDASIIYYNPTGDYVSNTNLSGFFTSYGGGAYIEDNSLYAGYGLFAPLMCESVHTNLKFFGYEYPYYTDNSWMCALTHVHAHGKKGFYIGGHAGEQNVAGTTHVLTACWSTATGANCFAYNFNMLWQVVTNGCAAEYVGDGGNVAQGIFNITKSYAILNATDVEQAAVKQFIVSKESTVELNGVNTYLFRANYADKNTYLYDVEWGKLTVRNTSLGLLDIHPDNTSNFVRLHGNVDFEYHTSPTDFNINGARGSGYTPQANDFVIYATENSHYNVDLKNGKTLTNRSISVDGALHHRNDDEYSDLNNLRATRKKWVFSAGSLNQGVTGDAYVLNFSTGNVDAIENNSAQIAINTIATDIKFRGAQWGGAYTGWRTVYTTANTTVDPNGFIKKASPIVKLFADHIELNNEAQNQEIVFEKLGFGDYLIKGSSGFAQDGWYIETPKDANGNVLFSVVYTTLENGDISVKTCKKKFDVETASIVADLDKPVDITDGRWIDLRLQELPQPEVEVTDAPEQ